MVLFQSTLPLREVTYNAAGFPQFTPISIHTSPEGSDKKLLKECVCNVYFNPHFPWGKWQLGRDFFYPLWWFQSTLPLREVTDVNKLKNDVNTFQSTLPLREVTKLSHQTGNRMVISIHTSPEGSDVFGGILCVGLSVFQSTLPLREVTYTSGMMFCVWRFQSTLPLREVTAPPLCTHIRTTYFNPHFPWGKWHRRFLTIPVDYTFQSTLPLREVTG